MKQKIFFYFLLAQYFIIINCLSAYSFNNYYNNKKYKIIILELNNDIDFFSLQNAKKTFLKAREKNADIIFLKINISGGNVEFSDSISNLILQSKIPVYGFIDNQSISSGTMIALSCKKLYIKPEAKIGGIIKFDNKKLLLSPKFQLYNHYQLKTIANIKNTNFQITDHTIDSLSLLNGQNISQNPLILSASEAHALHLCEDYSENLSQVIKLAGINKYSIIKQPISLFEQFIVFFTNPIVSGILIILIVGGLYFEMQSPEFGFPLISAIIAASLYFTSLYIEGSASYWEILLFIFGIILLSLEVFANPGFGISGIAGILLIASGFYLSLVNNSFYDFSQSSHYLILQSSFIVIGAMIISVVGSFYLSKKISTTNLFKYLTFKIIQQNDQASETSSLDILIGKTGKTHTILHPTGKIIIGGKIYEATTDEALIKKDEKILVTKAETSRLFVKKL